MAKLSKNKKLALEKLEKGKMYEAEEELKIANTSYWDNKLSQLIFIKRRETN